MSTATSSILNHAAAVKESYRYCRKLAKDRAKNFYYAFRLLDSDQRDGMCAVYAFMRHCDDLSDEPESDDKQAVHTESFALAHGFRQFLERQIGRQSHLAGLLRHRPALFHSAPVLSRND